MAGLTSAQNAVTGGFGGVRGCVGCVWKDRHRGMNQCKESVVSV